VFDFTQLAAVALPPSICYVGCDAFPRHCRISFMPNDVPCVDHECEIAFDSKRIVNRKAILDVLAECNVDLSTFEREHDSDICEGFGRVVSLYRRKDDQFAIVTKEFPCLNSQNNDTLLKVLEMLTHLKHRCISRLCGIIFPTDSTNLKIARLYHECGSLKEVLAHRPSWWTATAKSKAIAGIVIGMRFAHSLGCAHGSLKPSNILFDNNQNVQIVDFCSNRIHDSVKSEVEMNKFKKSESEFDEEAKALQMDVFSFSLILFEILVGRSVVAQVVGLYRDRVEVRFVDNGEPAAIPSFLREFVRELITKGWSRDRSERPSFDDISEVLKENNFDVVDGNDVKEVLRFVNFAEGSYE
jgi:serine/threonine protein kinase